VRRPPRSTPFAAAVPWLAVALLALPALSARSASAPPNPPPGESEDLAAARDLFRANLDAIGRKDRGAYLACYLNSPALARTGPEGIQRGFDSLAKETGSDWPDLFEGLDLQLVPVRPGLVYGTYRYRVRYGADEQSGISERFFLRTDQGWRIAVTTAFPAPPGTPPPPRALTGAMLVDGTGGPPIPDSVVLIRGGKVDCAGTRSRCPVPAGVETLSLPGRWITPGLIDAHVHFSQTGWADGRPDAIDVRERYPYDAVVADLRNRPDRFFRSYLCSGVTAVFDVGGYPWTWDLRKASSSTLAPHVAAAGPLLSTRDFWLNLPAERQFITLGTEEDAVTGVGYLASAATDAVKIWFLPAPGRSFEEMERVVLAAGKEAARRKLPLIVHATGLREAKVALRAGAHLLVHSVDDAPVDEEFLRLARESGAIYCPTLRVMDGYRRLRESAERASPPEVDDPGGCVDSETLAHVAETASIPAGPPDPKRAAERKARMEAFEKYAPANLKRVRDAGIPVATGTDAGNPLTLHGVSIHTEMEAMQQAGLTPMEVIVASTRGGALAMGRLKDLGTIEVGKEADMLVLEADPVRDVRSFRRILKIIRSGVIRDPSELRPAAAPSPTK
jgi:imidazolonepropionase-like amidohydrolase